MMHPLLKLMKRYCIDYTNSQDTSILGSLMTDDYVVHIAGQNLELTSSYKSGVEMLFGNAPGLNITVHQVYCNGDRVAMRFSEHGCFTDKSNALATWRGFATYKWDGERLTECWVEQDFYSRYQQIKTRQPHHPQPPAIDAWMTQIVPEDSEALEVARSWLGSFDLLQAKSYSIDDQDSNVSWEMALTPDKVTVHDVFSAGRDVPFHATVSGALANAPDRRADMPVCGVITVGASGSIERVAAVFDRFSTLIAAR